MWKKNRERREKRIKKQQRTQYSFVDQIKQPEEKYKFPQSQDPIEQERHLQLQYHKQINKYA